MIRKSSQIAWITVAFITIVMAFVVSLARLFFPLFEEYRTDIERLAELELGRPVKVQEVIADWSGLQPRIRIRGVSVYTRDGSRIWVKLDEVQIYFRVIDSIRSWSLRPGKINIVGADADVAFKEGNYYIGGVKLDNRHGVGRSQLLTWMLQRQKLVISRSRISWDDRRLSAQKQIFSDINLLIAVRTQQYNLSGSFRLKNHKNSKFNFIGDMQGSFLDMDKMKQSFYLSGNVDIGNWLSHKLIANTNLLSGQLNLRVWLKGIGSVARVFGDINVNKILWKRHVDSVSNGQFISNDRSFSLDGLSANFGWLRKQAGWQVNIKNIQWSRLGQKWPVSNIFLNYQRNNKAGTQIIQGRAGFIRLQDVGQLLLSVLPLNSALRSSLVGMNPRGDFSDITFQLIRKGNKIAHYQLGSRFEKLTVTQWNKLPGIKNLRGQILAHNKGGWLKLSSNKILLNLDNLMNKPLPIKRLSGTVQWTKTKNKLRIFSDHLIAKTNFIKTSSSLDMQLETAKPAVIDFRSNIKDGDFEKVLQYLPVKVMSPNLVRWLSGSLTGGQVATGSLIYSGSTKDFPFNRGNGTFDIKAQLNNVRMKFHPLWPAVKNGSASLHFFGKSAKITLQQGEILGLELLPTYISIPSLGKYPVINLDGNMIGSSANVLNFISAIPSKNGKNTVFERFKAGGRAVMHLNLTLPLKEQHKRRFIGRVELIDSSLSHKSYGVHLANINGDINYESDHGFVKLFAKKLRANYKNKPVNIHIDTTLNAKKRRFDTLIKLKSRLSIKHLLGDYSKYSKGIMSGTSAWILSFNIRQYFDRPIKVTMRLESLLKGIKIKLPQWFGKIKKLKRRLMIEVDITGEKLSKVQVDYGGFVNILMLLNKGAGPQFIERGEIRFGGKKAEIPLLTGLQITGDLSTFSVTRWQKWVASRGSLNKNSPGLYDLVHKIDLQFEELELVGNRIHQVRIKAKRDPTVWVVNVNGNEIKGRLRIPLVTNDATPLIAQLSVLKLVETDEDRKSEVPDPRKMPSLRIESKEFYYNGVYHGHLNIAANRIATGLRFDAVNMSSKYASVKARGVWKLDKGKQESKFIIVAKSSDLGKALKRRNYGVNMDKGVAHVRINAYWAGPPSWFRLKYVQGNLLLNITKGRILDIEPGTGKLFGMLSMSALPRRLSLDFSDIFKKGFSFDKINGKFTISNGDAYTNNLKLKSPVVTVEINGRLGLANQDYDQIIYIKPKITGTLPIVGGLAGGPGVGVGLWVADKILGKKLNPVSQYTVEGTWAKPIIKKVKVAKKRKYRLDTEVSDE
ncbi:hypothetical protein MNBD_GAMMA12-2037 [hydrothermal vent metagenome]|uniref:YhdP central domain-containing protein n=1 Tax=hydrothermal vent metagenome TaxID=652676 RepID=A0A3B0YUF2_9ZZZZ